LKIARKTDRPFDETVETYLKIVLGKVGAQADLSASVGGGVMVGGGDGTVRGELS